MNMTDWIAKINGFLTINDRDILTHAGNMSHDMAKAYAEGHYDQFHATRIHQDEANPSDFDRAVAQLPAPKPKTPRKRRNIADHLRRAMNPVDFRDYVLSFLRSCYRIGDKANADEVGRLWKLFHVLHLLPNLLNQHLDIHRMPRGLRIRRL